MDFSVESVKARMQAALRAKSSWADILFQSVNNRLIDTVAEAIAELARYDEYLTREKKWDLAQDISSLLTNSKFMQYTPHRKIGSSGDIKVSTSSTFNATPSNSVIIPKYTIFSNNEDIKFATTQDEILLTTDNYIEIPVIQGIPLVYTHIADGDEFEEIEIENDSIEDTLYDIYVEGELWTKIDDLNDASGTDKVYELNNEVDFSGITIKFGNNIFGKKLDEGNTVIIKYLQTLGVEGNVLSLGLITTVESTIYDENSSIVTLYCTNAESLDGGDDTETVEEIRTNGIDAFQAGDKAVTQSDYSIKLRENSLILKASVWGAYEYCVDNNLDLWTWIDTEENIVHVCAITPLGVELTEDQQESVIEDLVLYKSPTDVLQFEDVEFIYLIFHVVAKVADVSNVLSEVKSNIIDALEEEYSIENNNFFEHLYETEWKGIVSDVEGVTYHTSYVEIVKYETFNEAYLADITLNIYPIEAESIQVYIKDTTDEEADWELIGVDDGNGEFTAEDGYSLTGSLIDYSTGEGYINVQSGISGDYEDFSVRIVYQTDQLNICLTGRNQILQIEDATDVTATYLKTGEC